MCDFTTNRLTQACFIKLSCYHVDHYTYYRGINKHFIVVTITTICGIILYKPAIYESDHVETVINYLILGAGSLYPLHLKLDAG